MRYLWAISQFAGGVMKIALIGYSNCGKSTLARKLGEKHGIPVLYLDKVQFLPGWRVRAEEEKLRIVEDFLDENESWIIDGNYSSLYQERRMAEADRIVFMSFNRFTCLHRAYKRLRTNKGQARFSMTEGCPEKIDREFFGWLLFKGRSKKYKRRYAKICASYPEKLVVIKNQRQLDEFCKNEGLPLGE